jgi:hypothetical protein
MTFEERLGPPSSDAAARTSVERQCWSIEEMEVGAADSGGCPPYGWPAPPAELVGGRFGNKGSIHGYRGSRHYSCGAAGLDGSGKVILRRRMQRKTTVGLASKLSPCIIAMEACCGAHHLGQVFRLRHTQFG